MGMARRVLSMGMGLRMGMCSLVLRRGLGGVESLKMGMGMGMGWEMGRVISGGDGSGD